MMKSANGCPQMFLNNIAPDIFPNIYFFLSDIKLNKRQINISSVLLTHSKMLPQVMESFLTFPNICMVYLHRPLDNYITNVVLKKQYKFQSKGRKTNPFIITGEGKLYCQITAELRYEYIALTISYSTYLYTHLVPVCVANITFNTFMPYPTPLLAISTSTPSQLPGYPTYIASYPALLANYIPCCSCQTFHEKCVHCATNVCTKS